MFQINPTFSFFSRKLTKLSIEDNYNGILSEIESLSCCENITSFVIAAELIFNNGLLEGVNLHHMFSLKSADCSDSLSTVLNRFSIKWISVHCEHSSDLFFTHAEVFVLKLCALADSFISARAVYVFVLFNLTSRFDFSLDRLVHANPTLRVVVSSHSAQLFRLLNDVQHFNSDSYSDYSALRSQFDSLTASRETFINSFHQLASSRVDNR